METLRIVSYNLHWGGLTAGGVEPFDVEAACTHLGGDIRVYPERWDIPGEPSRIPVPDGFTRVDLDHHDTVELPTRYPHHRTEPRAGSEGITVVTNLPILYQRTLPVPLITPGPRRDRVLELTLDVGFALRVVAAHLSSTTPRGPITQLRALRPQLPDGPCVMVGDLNLWGTWATVLLPGWRRAVRGRTWPSSRPHSQIDNIFTKQMSVARSGVGPHLGSDHLPVWAEFALPGQHRSAAPRRR